MALRSTATASSRPAPDFEFHPVWDGRVFKGFERTMEWIADTRETWEDHSQEVEEIVVLGVAWTFDDGKAIEAGPSRRARRR